MERLSKTLLAGSPADVRKKVGELGRALPPHEHAAGARMQELAAELAQDSRFRVSVLTYGEKSQELEVVLTGDRHGDSIILSRSKSGTHCQLDWSRWLPIISDADINNAAGLIAAILEISAVPQQAMDIKGEG